MKQIMENKSEIKNTTQITKNITTENTITKISKTRIILIIGLCALLAPFIYSVYYSMPANDDFAWAISWFSSNRIVESFCRVGWNYMNSFGNSGIFAILIQVLFNPLYLFDNAGHSFGICMMVFFLLIFVTMIWAIRRLLVNLCGVTDDAVADVVTFLITVLLYQRLKVVFLDFSKKVQIR